MSRPRIVIDNSAILPAYFPEGESTHFDAGLVTNRARGLVRAIRTRAVNAFVPPSFFREFLNVATRPLFERGGQVDDRKEAIREQWNDLLSLPLAVVPVEKLLYDAGVLVLDDACPAADAWYVAAAMNARATLWMSHDHSDGLVAVASRHVNVRLLAKDAGKY